MLRGPETLVSSRFSFVLPNLAIQNAACGRVEMMFEDIDAKRALSAPEPVK